VWVRRSSSVGRCSAWHRSGDQRINALGTASIIRYAVPATLVVLGLRRQHPAALAAVALALTAVGITMYDGGSLSTHLTAIFVSVVVLTTVASTLVLLRGGALPPSARRLMFLLIGRPRGHHDPREPLWQGRGSGRG
jgi:hypothetical protein